MRSSHAVIVALIALVLATPVAAQAQKAPRGILAKVGFDQNLDHTIPLDIPFRDETGATVKLGDYFHGKPVVLSLVYFRCPMLCSEVLRGEVKGLADVPFDAGKDFEAVTVSFDPDDTPADAAKEKARYLAAYGHPNAAAGWHFLTGEPASIEKLTKAVGFRYARDPKTGQFAHAAGIMILTPRGKLSRYFYGVSYPASDLRLGLVDSSRGKIGSAVDAIILYCCRYDPATGKYGLIIYNVVKLFGLVSVVLLGGLIGGLVLAERRRRARAAAGGAE